MRRQAEDARSRAGLHVERVGGLGLRVAGLRRHARPRPWRRARGPDDPARPLRPAFLRDRSYPPSGLSASARKLDEGLPRPQRNDRVRSVRLEPALGVAGGQLGPDTLDARDEARRTAPTCRRRRAARCRSGARVRRRRPPRCPGSARPAGPPAGPPPAKPRPASTTTTSASNRVASRVRLPVHTTRRVR